MRAYCCLLQPVTFLVCTYTASQVSSGVMQIYCHYCPPIEGKESVEELGLPPNVRWLPHWKGRLMQYPDLTAL